MLSAVHDFPVCQAVRDDVAFPFTFTWQCENAKIQPIFFGMGANGLFNSNNVVTIQAEEYITILGDQRYRDKPITTHMNANTVNCIHQSEHAHIVIAHSPLPRCTYVKSMATWRSWFAGSLRKLYSVHGRDWWHCNLGALTEIRLLNKCFLVSIDSDSHWLCFPVDSRGRVKRLKL